MPNYVPTGGDLTTGTTDAATITTNAAGELRSISITPYALVAGTPYAILLKLNKEGDDYIEWRGIMPGTYGNGNFSASNDAGATWSDDQTSDLYFKEYAGATLYENYDGAGTSTYRVGQDFANKIPAQIFIPSISHTVDTIELRLRRYGGFTTAPPYTLTVSIRNVAAIAGELTGVIAVVGTQFHYVDKFGKERYIEGTLI
jgi:hypothetical protein